MVGNQLFALCAASAIVLGICVVLLFAYFIRREQRLVHGIQSLLEDAVEGRNLNVHLDESKLSAVENSMWRYLCSNQVSWQNLSKEKKQIQSQITDISHQTASPIANIVLYTQLLEESEGIPIETSKQERFIWLTAIKEQALKLDFLVESLVRLSRLETGVIQVNPQKQSIQPMLSSIQKQFMPKAENKNIRLHLEPTMEMAVFDRKWTMEAVANVVDNAIKYTPYGGKVSIGVEAYSFFVRIDITDNGIGIKEEEHALLFTRFYRSPDVREEPGLGVGLYLAREVIKAQHGYMKLSSQLGHGSVFSVFLVKEEMSQK